MCEYCFATFPNRLAEQGEELIAYKFPAGPLGFASLSDWRKLQTTQTGQHPRVLWPALKRKLFERPKASPIPAVCIPPGACLMLENMPLRLQRSVEAGPDEVVTFTGISTVLNSRRDALRFGNGRYVLLQNLEEGQRAKVLDLSISEAVAAYEEWLEES